MKYEVSGSDWSRDLVARTGPLRREWQVTVDDVTHTLLVEGLEGNQVLRLTVADTTHTLTLLPGNRPGQPLRFLLDDNYHELMVRDETDLLAELLGGASGAGGREEILSPMPGVIRKLLVEPGQVVAEDEPLLILEAMKMENEVRAPRAGTLSQLLVAEGDTVAAGAALGEIEAGS